MTDTAYSPFDSAGNKYGEFHPHPAQRAVFDRIYQDNGWQNDESVSGAGSTHQATRAIRERLPYVFERRGITSVLDIPCGDYNWWPMMKLLQPLEYIGGDVVFDLIGDNIEKFPQVDFRVLDVVRDNLPRVDLIFVRDLLGHLSNREVKQALANIRWSGARFLMATTFPDYENSGDIETGQWRPINLDQFWGLPPALEYINEVCMAGDGQFTDKSLGLWRVR